LTCATSCRTERFIPFLDYDLEIRRVLCSTNGIEPLNARFRAAMRRRGHLPDQQSALKVLYLAVMQPDKNRPNPNGRINTWTQILNTLTLICGDRLVGTQPAMPNTKNQTDPVVWARLDRLALVGVGEVDWRRVALPPSHPSRREGELV
jgi:Transposase, Mutator family